MKQGRYTKTAVRRFFSKQVFLKISRLKETPTPVLSCDYCKIFKSSFFYRTPPMAAFGYNNQWKVFREITTSKFQGQHAAQFNFCRYEGLWPAAKTKIQGGCFPRNFEEQLISKNSYFQG